MQMRIFLITAPSLWLNNVLVVSPVNFFTYFVHVIITGTLKNWDFVVLEVKPIAVSISSNNEKANSNIKWKRHLFLLMSQRQ